MGRIAVLSESLVNKIAAGEVVERPASVVKELVENSLDAGAKAVHVEVDGGGLVRMLVRDDGCGMNADDARLALERHATSKLADVEGLTRVGTFGFRGEAMPAIASVSRLTLLTRELEALSGTRILVEGGAIRRVEEVGTAPGTHVEVADLFFNTPARRKFMRRASTESGHCVEAVVRLALARPDVAVSLAQDGRTSFASPACGVDLRERVVLALGRDAFPHLLPLSGELHGIRVTGYAAGPDYSLSTSTGVYLYVNRRYVRDRGLAAAVQRSYAELLPRGRHPAAVIFLEVPLHAVDVNVHPQKLEVRFSEPREAFEAVHRALGDVLRSAPWLTAKGGGDGATAAPAVDEVRSRVAEAIARYAARPPSTEPGFSFRPRETGGEGVVAASTASPEEPRPADAQPPGYFASLRVIGQLAQTYLVCEAPGGGLVVVDQHAAHERVKFDALRRQAAERSAAGQPFLFAATVELPLADARVLAGHLDEVRALGFEIEPFGGATFALKAVPAPLVGADYAGLLGDLARELAQVEKGRAFDEAMNDILATMACHAAVRARQALSSEEARALLDSLDRVDYKARCPHGRPVAAELSLADLERRVGRR